MPVFGCRRSSDTGLCDPRGYKLFALFLASFFLFASSLCAQYNPPGSKLVGSGNSGISNQGFSVALSGDGNTAIVGGWNDNNQAGAAWIYTLSGGTWAQQGAKLVANDARGAANQGWSVALSADGNTAIVGGTEDNSGVGAAWIYTRSNGTWTQQGAKLIANDSVGHAAQGWSVSLSGDGNTALVGGSADNGYIGAVWIYTRSNGFWTQVGHKLVAPDSVGEALQGYSVALSSDGSTALAGGVANDSYVGATWVYAKTGAVWNMQTKLLVTDASGAAGQGQSVALSSDGNTALVGGSWDNSYRGAAWVFTRSGSAWTQQGKKLVGTGNVGRSSQGDSVAISGDGNTALVGGGGDASGLGAVWVFNRAAGVWSQTGGKVTNNGAGKSANQGQSVALSAGAGIALIGAPGDGSGIGSAAAFGGPANLFITSSQTGALFPGQTNAMFLLNVKNLGGAPSVGQVTVVEKPPSGLTVTSISGLGWSCSLQSLTCTRGDPLASGQSYPALTIIASVASGVSGTLANTASVSNGAGTGTGNSTGNTANTTIPVGVPGSVRQWGDTSHGQAGPPAGLNNAIAVAAGQFHSLALKLDGTVVQWGDTSQGQGTIPAGLNSITAIAAGGQTSLALQADATVIQWGDIAHNQGTPPAGLKAVAVAAGGFHSLALKSDGTVVQWGDTSHNQGSPPAGLTNVAAISAGTYHSIALKTDGTVVQWGDSSANQGTPPALNAAIAVAAGGYHTLALRSDNTVVQWGATSANQGAPPSGLNTAFAIAAGGQHSLVLKADGTVAQWGDTGQNQGAPPAGLSTVGAIAAGGYHSLAVAPSSPAGFITATAGTPQSVGVGVAFATALQAKVTDANRNPVAGATVTFTVQPAAGGAGAAFAGSQTATSQTGQDGLATAPTLTANSTLGSFTVSASVSGVATSASFALTIAPPVTALITTSAGTQQSVPVSTAFAPLKAKVTGTNSTPTSAATVTFTIQPAANGAGATFSSGQTATAQTDANGIATAPTLSANAVSGSFTVSAMVQGAAGPVPFALTSFSIAATPATTQSAIVNTGFAAPLQVTVTSAGTPLSGVAVAFSAPASGASALLSSSGSATTDGSGTARVSATANGIAGSYVVQTSVGGTATPVSFSLANIVTSLTVSATAGTPQVTQSGAPFAGPLQVTVTSGGVPVAGITVTFTAPAQTGASATLASATATTDASGVASVIATANATPGAYTVVAGVAGAPGSASFKLTNVSPLAFITSQTPSTSRNNFTGFIGSYFTVGFSPVKVTSLGRMYLAGNSGTHIVKLVTASDGNDVPGGSVSITMVNGTPDKFQYAALASPVVLQAFTSYYLVSQEASGGDRFYDPSPVVTSSGLTETGTVYQLLGGYLSSYQSNYSYLGGNFLYSQGATTAPPTVNVTSPGANANVTGKTVALSANATAAAGLSIVGVQFKVDGNNVAQPLGSTPYQTTFDSTPLSNGAHSVTAVATDSVGNATLSAPVSITVTNTTPPPSGTPFITSASLTSARNDFAGWVGMQFTVGAAPLTVSSLGRIFVTGNTGPHTVKLVDANSATDLPGGAITINMAGGTADQFKYASLPAPVTLQANTSYYLVSQELNQGDKWYDVGPASSTNVGSVDHGIYGSGSGQYNSYLQGGSYVPVNFLYSGGVSTPIPPAVAITQPSAGATIIGKSVAIAATATASAGLTIASVQFKLDGNNIGSPIAGPGPYATTFDSTLLINATHTLTALATDSAGTSASSAPVSVTVNNLTAPAPPTVSITSPTAGATISGSTVSVVATASASAGASISKVQFQVDGKAFGAVATTPSYQAVLDTTTLSDGPHNLSAIATDTSATSTLSTPVQVTVKNSTVPPGTPLITAVTTFGRQRNDFSGWAGMRFTVGPSALTVTALGRMFIAGNSGVHAIKIVKALDGSDVAGGSASITLQGGTAQQFKYVALPAPLVLAANTPYYIVSQEFSGGDLWYDYSPVTNTTAASVDFPASSTFPGYYGTTPVSGTVYVPVNLLYANGVVSAPPTVVITSPAGGVTISGKTVAVTANATAASGLSIASVQFKLDGNNLGNAIAGPGPYSTTLDTTSLTNAQHTLSAMATDSGGGSNTSSTVTVTVSNTAAPPAVAITAPANGNTISGKTVAVTANATAASGLTISSVQFKLDGSNLGSPIAGPGPYSTTLDTTGLTNAQHTLSVVATDSGGVSNTSATVTVTVSNTAAPPTVAITAPANGTTISGKIVAVTANAMAASGLTIASVQFKLDGNNLGNPIAGPGPYSTTLDTTSLSNAQHTLSALATDSGGGSNTSATVTVTVSNTAAPPTVAITAPANGTTISGKTVAVTANATAASGLTIASVQFKLDGNDLGNPIAGPGPYSTTLDTTGLTNAQHTLSAIAKDSAGVSATSSIITVTVNNVVATQTPFITSQTFGQPNNTFSGWVGMEFTVGKAALTVSSLGRVFLNGNTQTHTLKLVQVSNGADVPGASVSMTMSSPAQAVYQYAPLASPVTLQPNTAYYLLSQEVNGGDQWYNYGPVVRTSDATINGPAYSFGSSYFLVNFAEYAYVPLNFQYSLGSTSPPPAVTITSPLAGTTVSGNLVRVSANATAASGLTISTVQFQINGNKLGSAVSGAGPYSISFDSTAFANGSYNLSAAAVDSAGGTALSSPVSVTISNAGAPPSQGTPFITAQVLGATRNNTSSFVGMQFTTHSSALTVSQLGRIYVAGNTGSHVVKLVRGDGSDVPNGSVTLTMTAGTPGTYQYATLASPIVLQPNSTYLLVSQETFGGDFWYDYGPVTSTSSADVNGPSYNSGLYYTLVPTPGSAYGPLNFLYQ